MASYTIPQSVAFSPAFQAFLSDGVTPATGKTIAITISKNTAGFGNPSGGATNASEIASGWYYVALSTTDTATLGPLIVHGRATGVDPVDFQCLVVNPHNMGFDGIPAYTAGAVSGLPLSVDTSGRVDVLKVNGTSQTAGDIYAQIGVAGVGLTALPAVTLATSQPNYAPAKDGDKMDLVNAPNSTAVTAIQSGLATPTNITSATGVSLSSSGILAIWNQLTSDAGILANTFGVKIRDWILGLDNKVLISTDVQDVSATLSVNAKLLNGTTPNNLAQNQILYDTTPFAGADISKIKIDIDEILASLESNPMVSIPLNINGNTPSILRGDSGTLLFTGLGPITNVSKIYFTVKSSYDDADSASILQIEKTAGLLYVNGAAALSSTDAILTLLDGTAGNILISIKPNIVAELVPVVGLYFDIEVVHTDTSVNTKLSSTLSINADVTRAIS